MYLAFIPLYPAGMWSMAFASKGVDPLEGSVVAKADDACNNYLSGLKYYNASVHSGAFAIPNFVADIVK
jgi:spermidine synthase